MAPKNLPAFSKLSFMKAALIASAVVTLSGAALWASIATPQPTQEIRALYFRAGNIMDAQQKCGEIKESGWKIAKSSSFGCVGIKASTSLTEASCAIVGVDAFGSAYFKHIGDMSSFCRWSAASHQKIAKVKLSREHAAVTGSGSRAAQGISWSSEEQGVPLGFQSVKLTWLAPNGPIEKACQRTFGMKISGIGGCAKFAPEKGSENNGECSFVAPASTSLNDRSILGHEIKHCFDGAFHDNEQHPKRSYFKVKK